VERLHSYSGSRFDVICYAENLSPVDRVNLRRLLNAQTTGGHLVISRETKMSVPEMKELAAARYEVSKISFSPTERRAMPGGDELTMKFELPSRTPKKPALAAKLVLRTKGPLPEKVLAKLEGAVRSNVQRFTGEGTLIELQRSLRRVGREVPEASFDLELNVPSEAGDVIIAGAVPPPSRAPVDCPTRGLVG
jgi:hypothetical protein